MDNNGAAVSDPGGDDETEYSKDDPPQTISKDAAFHLLQNSRRRAVLRYLIARGEDDVSMRGVAERVAAWENDTTVSGLTSIERQRVYIALYQSHLPKLDDHGVIDYDRNRGTLSTTSLITVFEPYLDHGLDAPSVLRPDPIGTTNHSHHIRSCPVCSELEPEPQ